jgi:hypothetical protein
MNAGLNLHLKGITGSIFKDRDMQKPNKLLKRKTGVLLK